MNLRLHLFENKEPSTWKTFSLEILRKLSIQVKHKEEDLDYQDLFSKIYFDFSGKLLGASQLGDFLIIIDPNYRLMYYEGPLRLKEWTMESGKQFFTMTNGDTTGVYSYSFYREGEEVRSFSIFEDDNKITEKGPELDFESTGKRPFQVMENMGVPYDKFDTVKWMLLTVS